MTVTEVGGFTVTSSTNNTQAPCSIKQSNYSWKIKMNAILWYMHSVTAGIEIVDPAKISEEI